MEGDPGVGAGGGGGGGGGGGRGAAACIAESKGYKDKYFKLKKKEMDLLHSTIFTVLGQIKVTLIHDILLKLIITFDLFWGSPM
jgi:hypothetical protein